MTCPICDGKMLIGYLNSRPIVELFMCLNNECQLKGKRLTKQELDRINKGE